jgi:hypothetical protein
MRACAAASVGAKVSGMQLGPDLAATYGCRTFAHRQLLRLGQPHHVLYLHRPMRRFFASATRRRSRKSQYRVVNGQALSPLR